MAKPVDNEYDKNLNPKKSFELNTSTLMILSNVAIIIFILISMVVMYTLLESSMDKKLAKYLPEQESVEEEDDTLQQGILLDLGEFILNLADTTGRRYLKVSVAMELSKTEEEVESTLAPAKSGGHGHEAPAVDPNSAIVAEMERYKPAIRDAVISVLSSKSSDELSSQTGKEMAKDEILEAVNGIFAGQREVMRVSFGNFIIQ